MRVLGNAGGFRSQPDQFVAPVHGLDGAQPQAFQFRLLQDGAYQGGEAQLRAQIASPASEIDAGDDHLPIAWCNQMIYLTDHLSPWQGAAAPPYVRDHAK